MYSALRQEAEKTFRSSRYSYLNQHPSRVLKKLFEGFQKSSSDGAIHRAVVIAERERLH